VSLRSRVLAGIAVIAVMLGVVTVAITKITENNLLSQVDRQLTAAVGPIRDLDDFGRSEGGAGGSDDQAPNDKRPPSRSLSSLYVGIVDGADVDTVLTPNLREDAQSVPDIGVDQAVASADSGRAFTVGAAEGSLNYRVIAYTEDRSGSVVTLAMPLDSVEGAVGDLMLVEAVGALVILAALAALAWWVIHLGVRPVQQMTGVAASIAGGDLSHRVPEADPRTEAGELAAALNMMLGRIETSFDEQRHSEERLRDFVADASHELRTPVATIRGYAELYRVRGLEAPGALDDAMGRTEAEAIRMGLLVDDLLTLARADQDRPLEMVPVDLSALARDAAADAGATEPDRPITPTIGEALLVQGDQARLRQVVANLITNALVHTPHDTPVRVETRRDGSEAVLVVSDDGPGMEPEAMARAFERFYRADPSRSRHSGGSGLGLSIVESMVKAHGGTVELDSAPGVGTTVSVRLPLADEARSASGKASTLS
jgi:two-component system OmpR family sensor kinase